MERHVKSKEVIVMNNELTSFRGWANNLFQSMHASSFVKRCTALFDGSLVPPLVAIAHKAPL
jgi:hypothetical protein